MTGGYLSIDGEQSRYLRYRPTGSALAEIDLFDGSDWQRVSFLPSRFSTEGLTLDLGVSGGPPPPPPGGPVLITGGTPIGTLTQYGGIAAAFDGNISQTYQQSAYYWPSTSGYGSNFIGKDWGAGNQKTVVKFVARAPSNNWFGPGGARLECSQDGSTWTVLFTGTLPQTPSVGQVWTVDSGITQTAGRMHRLNMEGNGSNSVNMAELEFYEAGQSGGGSGGSSSTLFLPNTTYDFHIINTPTGPKACARAWASATVRGVANDLAWVDGIAVNAQEIECLTGPDTAITVPPHRARNIGTFKTDEAETTVTFHKTPGPNRKGNIWNRYNQKRRSLRCVIPPPSGQNYWQTTPNNPQSTSQVPFAAIPDGAVRLVVGQAQPVDFFWHQSGFLYAPQYASMSCGIGINGSIVPSGYWAKWGNDTPGVHTSVMGAARCLLDEAFGAITAQMLIRVGALVGPSVSGSKGIATAWGGDSGYSGGDEFPNQMFIPAWMG